MVKVGDTMQGDTAETTQTQVFRNKEFCSLKISFFIFKNKKFKSSKIQKFPLQIMKTWLGGILKWKWQYFLSKPLVNNQNYRRQRKTHSLCIANLLNILEQIFYQNVALRKIMDNLNKRDHVKFLCFSNSCNFM